MIALHLLEKQEYKGIDIPHVLIEFFQIVSNSEKVY